MDLKQVTYMITIAEENNITKAAEKLFITQSALNQQLLKLEKQLGTPLFVRSRNNWHLTKAGEIYIENAKKLVSIQKNTYSQINDLIDGKKSTLTIGLTPGRGPDMFAAIYPVFYKNYPHVKIEPVEMSVKEQQKKITQEKLDIGFVTLQDFQKTDDEYIQLCTEKIVLAVPSAHPLAYLSKGANEVLATISLKLLQHDLFALMQTGSTLREICDEQFSQENCDPLILLETKNSIHLHKMVEEGICCSIFPRTYAKQSDGISYFSLQQNPLWQVCAIYKKNSYLNQAAKALIELAADYWRQKTALPYNNFS